MLVLAAVVLSACAETQFLAHTFKRYGQDDNAVKYKVGNPYQIAGVWYYPAVDYSYDETGIASWYGPNFHAKLTANGETFDQNAITAAHRTLPMPSVVRVTNLDNGRSVVVRVNDRGPFAKGRIIDMSRRSAELLGFKDKGTARVRVQILAAESRKYAEGNTQQLRDERQLSSKEAPIKVASLQKDPVLSENLLPPPGATATAPQPEPLPEASPEVTEVPVSATKIYVQAGAFANLENANRVKLALAQIGDVEISTIVRDGRDLFRVRIGPLGEIAEADQTLDRVINAGFSGARTIVD